MFILDCWWNVQLLRHIWDQSFQDLPTRLCLAFQDQCQIWKWGEKATIIIVNVGDYSSAMYFLTWIDRRPIEKLLHCSTSLPLLLEEEVKHKSVRFPNCRCHRHRHHHDRHHCHHRWWCCRWRCWRWWWIPPEKPSKIYHRGTLCPAGSRWTPPVMTLFITTFITVFIMTFGIS